MNTSNQVQVVASDVTGQRLADWQVADQIPCGAILTQAVERLQLPVTQATDGSPIAYHTFEEGTGEQLPAEERLADVIQRYRLDMELPRPRRTRTRGRWRMTDGLQAALLLPDGQIAELVTVPASVLRRVARRTQSRTLAMGMTGPCTASVVLSPRRTAPALAAALNLCLADDGRTFVSEMPISVLEPLLDLPADTVRRAYELLDGTVIGYMVPMAAHGSTGPVWSETLPPFCLQRTGGIPATEPLASGFDGCGDIPVVAVRSVLKGCVDYCRDAEVEKGGVLLGHVNFAEKTGAGLWVEVVAFAPAVGAAASAQRLLFNSAAWRNIERFRVEAQRKLDLTRPLQIVGWVHGHPRLKETGGSPFFLSSHDVAIMVQHFSEPYAIAVVVDAWSPAETPVADAVAVFGWDAGGISIVRRSLNLSDTRWGSHPETCL